MEINSSAVNVKALTLVIDVKINHADPGEN